MSTTTVTKEQKIDAAVAAVQKRAAAALRGEPWANEYSEAHTIALDLEDQGLLVRVSGADYNAKEQARKRLEGQAKRLLDEEAAKPDARVLRFSSHDHALLPRLNGSQRGLYGQAVGYTTPELYQRAVEAVQAAKAQQQTDAETMATLLQQAAAAGLPEPINHTGQAVTYDVDGLRALIAAVTSV